MSRTVAIGIQDFGDLIRKNYFYIDKTAFIKEWWESGDSVTLITRPRRFGKTLNMSMVEHFFSVQYAGQESLFEGLAVWKEKAYRELQGTYPVISLSFANIKESNYQTARKKICQLLANLYTQNAFLLDSGILHETDINYFQRVSENMDDADATLALYQLSSFLCRYYGKKVIILLDEYDTPMQEAYVNGYWRELTAFTRSLFNSSLKTNPWLERAIMTGITRVSRESVFSDLNNLKVVTTTSEEYAVSFGFTEEEVFTAMEEYGCGKEKETVRRWYDGFVFGPHRDIYNPWSVLNFLDTGKCLTYWANTSSNSLVGKLIREGDRKIKMDFEELLRGGCLLCPVDEQIVYDQLDSNDSAIWSLLLASGYLKVLDYEREDRIEEGREPLYRLTLTNYEVKRMFDSMVRGWFQPAGADYNDFVKALLLGDLDAINVYMNRVASQIFSYFDVGRGEAGGTPERFYHGFVLGILVDLQNRYVITSNRESGFGRYDVMIEPRNSGDDAMILEFKVLNPRREKTLEDTARNALEQIEARNYEAYLSERGILKEQIRKYGFAFQGKTVLIEGS